VKAKPFLLLYSPSVSLLTEATVSQLEEATKRYLNYYLGLRYSNAVRPLVNFLGTQVVNTGFLTSPGFPTRMDYNVTVRFEPNPAQEVPESNEVTMFVVDAFSDPAFVNVYIQDYLNTLPITNGFRATNDVQFLSQ
jgi:hypothetical protein